MLVVRRFCSEDPPLHTKQGEQYYEAQGEARRLYGTVKSLYKDDRRALGDEFRESPRLKESGPLEDTSKVVKVEAEQVE